MTTATTPTIEKTKPTRKEQKDLIDEEYKKESRLIKGVFRNLETPGLALKFSYRKFPQQPIVSYNLEDGAEYELPLCVVKHINSGCSYAVHQYAQDKDGKVHPLVGRRIQRYQFQPSSYLEAGE